MSQKPKKTSFSGQKEVATLGGGCFWCTEAVFNLLKGVIKVDPGYSGGNIEYPTYEQVSTGTTGHAEVVRIIFDPEIISFKDILEIFFTIHNPTMLNRQGSDVGTQYRSVIFYHDEKQRAISAKVIKEITEKRIWKAPIVTQLEPFKAFYKAEDYHKDYFMHHLEQPYCRLIIEPKIVKLRRNYLDKLRKP